MTEEEVEPADTDHETEKQRPRTRWGIVTSVLLHVPVVALLIFGLPKIQAEPGEEESVKVELVPPPEEKKAEEKPKEEEKPQEQAKAEPPPPPPPPPAKQEKPPEQTPPPEEQRAQADERQGRPPAMPVLRPVFEFGEKDAGPEKSLTGDSSVAGEKPPAEAKTDAEQPKPAETASAEKPPASEEPPAPPVPQEVEVPEVSVDETHAEGNGPPAEAPDEAKTSLEQAKPSEKPAKVAEPPKPRQMAKLTEAKTLFSRAATDDPAATTAMGNLSRGDRVALLCSTELSEQLRHALPDYNLEALPRRRLQRGTMLQVKDAFRADGRWYDLSYRCEIDADAMKVVSFAFDVGDPIPRSEWRKRGLPDF
jgi:hypothetical protein